MSRRRINKGRERKLFKKLNARRREARALLERPDTWPEHWIMERVLDSFNLKPASWIILRTGTYTGWIYWEQENGYWTGDVDEFEGRIPTPHVSGRSAQETLDALKSFIVGEIARYSERREIIPDVRGDGLLHIVIHKDDEITTKRAGQ